MRRKSFRPGQAQRQPGLDEAACGDGLLTQPQQHDRGAAGRGGHDHSADRHDDAWLHLDDPGNEQQAQRGDHPGGQGDRRDEVGPWQPRAAVAGDAAPYQHHPGHPQQRPWQPGVPEEHTEERADRGQLRDGAHRRDHHVAAEPELLADHHREAHADEDHRGGNAEPAGHRGAHEAPAR